MRGVSFNKQRDHYSVRVSVKGRDHFGGSFTTLDEAEVAAIAFRISLMTNNLVDRYAAYGVDKYNVAV